MKAGAELLMSDQAAFVRQAFVGCPKKGDLLAREAAEGRTEARKRSDFSLCADHTDFDLATVLICGRGTPKGKQKGATP